MLMLSVFGMHTLAIIVIEVYNFIYLVENKESVKKGILGDIYQGIKVIVLAIDIVMITLLGSTFNGLLKIKIKIIR